MNGTIGLIATDQGDHDPLKWAMATADHLVHVAKSATPDKQLAGRKLETAIAEALLPHHDNVQATERARLAVQGDAVITFHPDPQGHIDDAIAAVNACVKGTIFETQWMMPEWQQQVRATLANHFATSMWNAHSWHVDKNPNLGLNATAFRVQRDQVQGVA